jgi:hypothetical protein
MTEWPQCERPRRVRSIVVMLAAGVGLHRPARLLRRPLIRPRFGIAGIKMLNLILPHLHEDTGG